MFKVALRMFWSDIRTFFQGWAMCVVLAFIGFLVGVLPMVADFGEGSAVGACGYGMAVGIMWLAPRFTRAFHVVPFTIKQIKSLVVYRCIIFVGIAMLIGGIYLALAFIFSWEWNPGFGLWYFFYAELQFVFVSERLRGFHEKKYKTNIWLGIWTAAVMVASAFVAFGVLEDWQLYVQYLVQVVLFALYLPFPASLFKNMDFYDYKQVRDTIGGRPSFLE